MRNRLCLYLLLICVFVLAGESVPVRQGCRSSIKNFIAPLVIASSLLAAEPAGAAPKQLASIVTLVEAPKKVMPPSAQLETRVSVIESDIQNIKLVLWFAIGAGSISMIITSADMKRMEREMKAERIADKAEFKTKTTTDRLIFFVGLVFTAAFTTGSPVNTFLNSIRDKTV